MKNIKCFKKLKNLILLFCMIFSHYALALDIENQSYGKHPKVIELEMMLTKEATSFIQSRIQHGSVYVNVQIEPLRRTQGSKSEQLPYFYSEDEAQDEWDAIDSPMVLLLSRIKKANIKIEVPSNITENETADLKEKLFEHLKLVPVRDQITIERKDFFQKTEPVKTKDYSQYYFLAGIILLGFIGLFITLRFTSHKVVADKKETGGTGTSTSSNQMMPMRHSGPHHSAHKATNGVSFNSKVNGDINFKDSIRAADMLKEKLHGVVNATIFPTLSDMVILEELAKKSLASFGAFVFEMPRKHQQKVFFRAPNDTWFKGYVEAAGVDLDCFMAVEKMLRARNTPSTEKWEELIIQVWRLGEDAPIFLKQINTEDAFTIMSALPKSFSVPCAKKSFPGGWAKILDSRETFALTDEAKITDYFDRTLKLKPFYSFKSIDDYKKDLELIDYLKIASLKDEEEIYEALNSDSQIFNLRPPFYRILKSDEDELKIFFEYYELSDWALAMINAPRELTQCILKILDAKKKYIFKNFLRQIDEGGFDLAEQTVLRENMALKFKMFIENKKIQPVDKNKNIEDINHLEHEDDEAKAA